jgi:hypothetical protein
MWPLIVGGKSDKECWRLSKVEQTMKEASALPATINGDKGFASVEIKDPQLTLSVPIKNTRKKLKKGGDEKNPLCIDDGEEEEEEMEEIQDEDQILITEEEGEEGENENENENENDNNNESENGSEDGNWDMVEEDYDGENEGGNNNEEEEEEIIDVTIVKEEKRDDDTASALSTPISTKRKLSSEPTVDVNGQYNCTIVLENWLIATQRVTVEQFFGRLKNWAECGRRVQNRALEYYEAFVFSIVIMCNYITKPLHT